VPFLTDELKRKVSVRAQLSSPGEAIDAVDRCLPAETRPSLAWRAWSPAQSSDGNGIHDPPHLPNPNPSPRPRQLPDPDVTTPRYAFVDTRP